MEYRKKPVVIGRKKSVVIEAFQYDGDMIYSGVEPYAPAWALHALEDGTMYYKDAGELYIKTLVGDLHVSIGDYVVRDDDGDIFPCKPDIFERTYEAVL